jgi:hypothetical protein
MKAIDERVSLDVNERHFQRSIRLSLTTDISICKFELKTPNEKFLWNACKQSKSQEQKLQQDKNFTLTKCEIDTNILENVCLRNQYTIRYHHL